MEGHIIQQPGKVLTSVMSTRKLFAPLAFSLMCALGLTPGVANAAPTPAPLIHVYPGMSIAIPSSGQKCSLTAPLNDFYAMTAAHCILADNALVIDGITRIPIGIIEKHNYFIDRAYIKLTSNTIAHVPQFSTDKLAIGDHLVVKSGMNRRIEGSLTDQPTWLNFFGPIPLPIYPIFHQARARMCSQPGDSGAPVFYKGMVVGMVTGNHDGAGCSPSTRVAFSSFADLPPQHM